MSATFFCKMSQQYYFKKKNLYNYQGDFRMEGNRIDIRKRVERFVLFIQLKKLLNHPFLKAFTAMLKFRKTISLRSKECRSFSYKSLSGYIHFKLFYHKRGSQMQQTMCFQWNINSPRCFLSSSGNLKRVRWSWPYLDHIDFFKQKKYNKTL